MDSMRYCEFGYFMHHIDFPLEDKPWAKNVSELSISGKLKCLPSCFVGISFYFLHFVKPLRASSLISLLGNLI